MPPRQVDVLLIGGGVASVRCARALRRRGFDGSILLVGEEPSLPYNRPPLSKELLRGEAPVELAWAEQPEWYARQRIELSLGTAVLGLDPAERLVSLADGSALRFGQCLVATGAAPRAYHAPLPCPLMSSRGKRQRNGIVVDLSDGDRSAAAASGEAPKHL